VMWIQHTTGAPGAADYWSLYFENFISDDKRAGAVAALTADSPLHALHSDLDIRSDDEIMRKYRFSLFARNPRDPEALLRKRGIDTVIVVGTATNMCCESTARDAMMRDFRVFMPHDAVAAPRADGHVAGLRSVMQGFADVRATDVVIDLIERAGRES
jgi:ureidoacrylate peracid hydrolase